MSRLLSLGQQAIKRLKDTVAVQKAYYGEGYAIVVRCTSARYLDGDHLKNQWKITLYPLKVHSTIEGVRESVSDDNSSTQYYSMNYPAFNKFITKEFVKPYTDKELVDGLQVGYVGDVCVYSVSDEHNSNIHALIPVVLGSKYVLLPVLSLQLNIEMEYHALIANTLIRECNTVAYGESLEGVSGIYKEYPIAYL